MGHKILLTGATGFIGGQLFKQLITLRQPIILLIRSSSQQNARQRFTALLLSVANELKLTFDQLKQQCVLVEGDITKDLFGLNKEKFHSLANSIDTIYHAAASVHLTAPLEEARMTNVKGTLTILKLAHIANNLKRLNYISTAYVAGKRKGVILENELVEGQQFNNNYEQAKYEAELAVEQAKAKLPISIFRPSMVMGDSTSGWTSAFNVLYGPIKMGYFGNLPIVPGCKKSKLDAISIDYVTNAIFHLSQLDREVIGRTFHISAGKNKAINAREMLLLSRASLQKWIKHYQLINPNQKPKMIHPVLFKSLFKLYHSCLRGEQKQKMDKLFTYINYTLSYKEFDSSAAEKLLIPVGIVAPDFKNYLDVVCKYAIEKHFGKANSPQHVYKKNKATKPIPQPNFTPSISN